ncbi:Hsp70 family protein [Lacrimispora sp. 210928-DFI.3.58]|uniref:Hsp70 family protein n=1 Tax=Lacrimispora sp. 210928-DFI.3.58 TaxID=2883214 RepID=UPI001D07CD15|nr:Hsp70 family protein [Lacrimispora sp. 210928-DFI.3.58]MCB7317771.1 Hsp70 family protein [Lacrimispora sp. 210928-DFI.3.58]
MNAAFLISCSTYGDPRISALKYPENDRELMRTSLVNYCRLKEEEIFTISSGTDKSGCRSERNAVISFLCKKKEELTDCGINNLIVYFSGHGFHSGLDGHDYIALGDACLDYLEETSISLELLCRILKGFDACHIILFIDACKSVVYSKAPCFSRDYEPDREYLKGISVFFSCSANQEAFESKKLGASIFTYCLTEALSEKGKCRTVRELNGYLKTEVPLLCQKCGKKIQNPYISVEDISLADVNLLCEITLHSFRDMSQGISWFGKKISEDIIFALDFGSSKTILGVAVEETIYFLPSLSESIYIPTWISFDKYLNYWTGEDAQRKSDENSYVTINDFKRYLGTGKEYQVFDVSLPVEIVALLYIKSIMKRGEQYFGIKVKHCMIATPGNFGFQQNNALEAVIMYTGAKLIRSIGEPCCAGLNYPYIQRERAYDKILVVDMGGGTTDLSVMEAGDGVLETLFVAGDNEVGGLDYDRVLYDHILQSIKAGLPEARIDDKVMSNILKEAEAVKKKLSKRERAELLISDLEDEKGFLVDFSVDISRKEFAELTNALNKKIEHLLKNVQSFLSDNDMVIDSILLGGLGTRICSVTELIKTFFPDVDIIDRYCENAVILGLCNYAGLLSGLKPYGGMKEEAYNILLLDNLYYGLEIGPDDEHNDILCDVGISVPFFHYQNYGNAESEEWTSNIAEYGKLHRRELDRICTLKAFYSNGACEVICTFDQMLRVSDFVNGEVEIIIDVDANRTVLFTIAVKSIKKIMKIQINNFFSESKFYHDELLQCGGDYEKGIGKNSIFREYEEKVFHICR